MKGCQNDLNVGQKITLYSRICVDDQFGTVRYIGEVDGTIGAWLGVEWDNPDRGKHDGIYKEKQYFRTDHPTSGSFIRPERVTASRSCAQAIRERYGEQVVEVMSEQDRKLACSVNKVIEFVGAEKMALKISKLINLREASLKNMCISGEADNKELETLTPNLEEIDLSRNLLNDWSEIANIVVHLPSLHTLMLSENLLTIPDNAQDLSMYFGTIQTLILNKMQYTWNEILQCSLMLPNIENLSLSGNRITKLDMPLDEDYLKKLKFLDLSFNCVQSCKEIEKLGQLPSLQKLNLSHTGLTQFQIETPGYEHLFRSLEELDLSHNHLANWLDISELNKLCKLRKLKINVNPIIKSESWETSRQLVIAKVKVLTKLDGIQIEKQERKDAERDYLKKYYKEWRDCNGKNSNLLESFYKLHPNYERLVKLHGASEEGEVIPQNLMTKISLLAVQIYSPTMPDKPIIQRKIPASMTVGKLKALLHRVYNVSVGDLILSYKTNKPNGVEYELNNDLQTLSYFEIKNGDIIQVAW